jgi:hypothetical protein
MKIAIYEPEPRVCGPMASAFHLQWGFRSLAHQCDVVSFTKSGKSRIAWAPDGMRWGVHWWRQAPDVVAKYKDSAEVLDSYDAVILTDARTAMQDKAAKAGRSFLGDTPDYISVLASTKKPFTFALHGNMYPPSELQYTPQMLELPNFAGRAITYSLESINAGFEVWSPAVSSWIHSPLPFHLSSPLDAPATNADPIVGITGRYVPNKGHHALALASAYKGYPKVKTELWGSCSIGAGPSMSFQTYEYMTQQMGLPGERFGNDIGSGHGGDLLRGYPWEVKRPDGHYVSYMGGYPDAASLCKRLMVHVDLTSSNFSGGLVEFSQLEAIDAGCNMVALKTVWHDDLIGTVLPEVPAWKSEKKLWTTPEGNAMLASVANGITTSLADDQRDEHAVHNRRAVARINNPAIVAERFLRAMEMA